MSLVVRFLIALGILLPYQLLPIPRPIWLTFTVAFAAFGLGHLVVRVLKKTWAQAIAVALVAAGGAVTLAVGRPARAAADAYVEAGDPAVTSGRRVRMHGHVAAGTLQLLAGSRRVDVEGPGGARVPVVYDGILPDNFREQTEVVVTGALKDGVFEADSLLAKCPSRYRDPNYAKFSQ